MYQPKDRYMYIQGAEVNQEYIDTVLVGTKYRDIQIEREVNNLTIEIDRYRNMRWYIDDLVPQDKVIIYDRNDVIWNKDPETGKESIFIKKHKSE